MSHQGAVGCCAWWEVPPCAGPGLCGHPSPPRLSHAPRGAREGADGSRYAPCRWVWRCRNLRLPDAHVRTYIHCVGAVPVNSADDWPGGSRYPPSPPPSYPRRQRGNDRHCGGGRARRRGWGRSRLVMVSRRCALFAAPPLGRRHQRCGRVVSQPDLAAFLVRSALVRRSCRCVVPRAGGGPSSVGDLSASREVRVAGQTAGGARPPHTPCAQRPHAPRQRFSAVT